MPGLGACQTRSGPLGPPWRDETLPFLRESARFERPGVEGHPATGFQLIRRGPEFRFQFVKGCLGPLLRLGHDCVEVEGVRRTAVDPVAHDMLDFQQGPRPPGLPVFQKTQALADNF